MAKRRTRWVMVGLAGVVALAVVGWVAGRGIRSPAEVAAGVAPPQPSLITVAVVRRKLATEVIVRGTARYGAPQAVILPTSTLKSGSELVSQVPLPNTRLREGSVALSVSGRPVFVLRGVLPAIRDLVPGTEGADVMQLERALARLGFSPGAIDGRYDGATAVAVAAWYRKAGWTPFGPTAGQADQLRAAQATAATAQDTVLQTRLALKAAARGATPAEVNQARQDVVTAADGIHAAALAIADGKLQVEAAREAGRRARDAEKLARITSRRDATAAEADQISKQAVLSVAIDAQAEAQRRLDQPPADTQAAERETLRTALRQAIDAVTAARSSVEAARSALAAANAVAAAATDPVAQAQARAEVAAAEANLVGRQAALTAAVDAQAEAQRQVDRPTIDTVPARQAALAVALRQATDAVAVARSAYAAASTAAAAARAAQSAPVLQAQADVRAANRDARLATAQIARAQQALVSSRRQASLARARSSILTGKTDATIERQIVAAAEAEWRRADAEVAHLTASTGVQIPAGEVLFFPVLPLRVDTVNVLRGEPVSGPVMTVSNSRVAIDSSLSINDARLVRVGMPVVIEEQDLRIRLRGTVTRIANKPGTIPTDPQRVYFEVTPATAPPAIVGASVRLAIAVSSTRGAVLAVPVSALSVVADGTSRIQVDRGGKTVFVTVEPGLAAQGLVEVRPLGRRLRPGDRVVVGVGTSALANPTGVGSGPTPALTPSQGTGPATAPAPTTTPAATPTPVPAPATTTPGAGTGNAP